MVKRADASFNSNDNLRGKKDPSKKIRTADEKAAQNARKAAN